MLSVLTDFADYSRARRNVLICAVAIFLTSSVSLASNKMSVFGLEVFVSIPRLVGMLQIGLIFLFLIFFLYTISRAPSVIMREVYRLDRIWERKARKDLERMNLEMAGNSDPDFSPYDDYDGFYYLGVDVRRRRRARLFVAGYFLNRLVSLIVSLGIPILFSWFALFKPSFISEIVTEKIEAPLIDIESQMFCPSEKLNLPKSMQMTCSYQY
jgi:hypothetical protein